MDRAKEVYTKLGIGVFTTLIGGYDVMLRVLLILMAIDILTGVYKGLHQCNFSSRAFRQGLLGKSGFIMVIILCYQMDVLLEKPEPMIRNIGTIFYIAVEGTSILENLGEIGVPVPLFIKERLTKLKDGADSGTKEIQEE